MTSVFNKDSFSQISADSLGKYSYPLIALNNNYFGGGTCFFIKKNSSFYLVSAKHNVLGCDDFGNLDPEFPDQLIVGLIKDIKHSFTIDTKVERGKVSCKGFDVYVKKIDPSYANFYNSVEAFIKPSLLSFTTLEVFGYPEEVYRKDIAAIPSRSIHSTIHMETFDFDYARDSLDKIDTLQMRISCPASVSVTHGFSGAPLFLQDSAKGNWRLVGLIRGGGPAMLNSRKSLYFVDIKHIMAIIDKIH